jgi:RimJ/RimL family protein N-acetyltransferase
MLIGNKVILRPYRRLDIPLFLKWLNDPEVVQYLSLYLPLNEWAEEKYIEHLGHNFDKQVNWVIEAVTSGEPKPIGSLGLNEILPKDRMATFGIAIGEKDYWSQGYGTQAAGLLVKFGFEQMNLHRINSIVYAFNERSLKMHRRIGFQQEGIKRQAVFKNGQYHDVVEFGLLEDEWRGK